MEIKLYILLLSLPPSISWPLTFPYSHYLRPAAEGLSDIHACLDLSPRNLWLSRRSRSPAMQIHAGWDFSLASASGILVKAQNHNLATSMSLSPIYRPVAGHLMTATVYYDCSLLRTNCALNILIK